MDTAAFEPFPKMARLSRGTVVTEKIDGTNAQVFVGDDGSVRAGSRNRWIFPGKSTDNYGFAGWVADNEDALRNLGPGRHYGEWWGQGIQSGYGLSEKRFSLFNTGRWSDDALRPACCGVVPVLYTGLFDEAKINGVLTLLASGGSVAAPGFMQPEGIVIYHSASGMLFKKTITNDEVPKGIAA